MSSTSLVLLLAAAAAVNAAFFESGACSTESITKTRQPLIQNPAVGASRICFDFDLARDDASKLLQAAGISESTPHLANASQCEALLNAAADDAFSCIQLALTGAGLDNGAISAAIDIATAVGCTEFNKKTSLVAALKRNDISGAERLLETDAFCATDACRCLQNRYCISPCDLSSTQFDATCAIAPGSALCAGATTVVGDVSDAATTAAPVKCSYSAWRRKTACSATCKSKTGYETFTRTVNDLQACTESLTDERACKASDCDAPADPYGGGGATKGAVVNQNQNQNNQNNVELDDQTLGAIIGGSIAAVLVLGLCIFFIRRRNNSKDNGDVYNPEQQAPAVGNPLFNDNQQRGENPLFSEDSLQKLEVPAAAAAVPVAAAAAVVAAEEPATRERKSRKASKKKVRDEAEMAVCITCGKEFKDSALLRMHATTHQQGNDNDANETMLSDGDTFGRTDSTLGNDKPLPLGYSEQGSVANLMVNDNL